MNSRLALLVLVIGVLAIGIGEQHVFADEELEELVVTARKRVEQLSEVPVSITTFNSESILEKGVTELNQLEKFAPNTVQNELWAGKHWPCLCVHAGHRITRPHHHNGSRCRDLLRWRLLGPQHGCKLGSGKS